MNDDIRKLFELAKIPVKKKINYRHTYEAASGNSCLYAIGHEGSEFTKIGMARRPMARMRSIQGGNALELHMLYFIEAEAQTIQAAERYIHRSMAAKGMKGSGEWWNIPRPQLGLLFRDAVAAVGGEIIKSSGCPWEESTEEAPESVIPVDHWLFMCHKLK